MTKILGSIIAGVLLVGLFALPASAWPLRPANDRTDNCNPYTYGRPNSCHVAPVQSDRHVSVDVIATWHRIGVDASRAKAEPLVLDTANGIGHAAVAAWSRGYHRVMLYGEYHGAADVRLSIDCPGFHRSPSWTDTGPRFRFVTAVPAYTRCTYHGVIRTNNFGRVFLGIGAFG